MSEVRRETPIGRLLPETFGVVSRRVPLGADPLLLYAILVAVAEFALQTARALEGYPPFYLVSPLSLLRPALLLGAALVTRRLYDRYASAVAEMSLSERADNAAQFERLVPPKLVWGLITVGVAFTFGNLLFVITLPELSTWAVADILQRSIIVPFGYVPVFAMFLATYISIEVLVPRRIAKSDIGLYYHDPENLGGMRPVGELVKYAYYYLLVGLIVYAIALYGPYILGGVFHWSSENPPGMVANVLFTAVWGASVGVMMYGIHTLHRFMHRQKREKLQRLDARAREYLDEPWDVEQFDIPDDAQDTYDDIRTRQELVAATREYPATFTMWAQFAIGIIIPKAVQFALAAA